MIDKNNSTKMISKEMSALLRKSLFDAGSHRSLYERFTKYLKEEPYCARDISKVLFAYDKIILHNCLVAFSQSSSEGLPEAVVLSMSNQIKTLLQCTFAAGLMYGKAKVEEDFIKTVKDMVENQQFDDIDAMVSDSIKGINEANPTITREDLIFDDDDEEDLEDDIQEA